MPSMNKPTATGGRMKATFTHISDDLIEARDNWPAALRAVYASDDAQLSLAVPLDKTCAQTVRAFVTPYEGEIPTDETGLRNFLRDHIIQNEIWISAYKGFVKGRLAPVGKHAFQLHQIRRFTRKSDDGDRIGFTVHTDLGLEAGFTAPWPGITAVRGETPGEDQFEINTYWTKKLGAKYLLALGLDMDKWEEEMQQAEALWPRTGVKSMFSSESNLCPEILQAVARHGAQYVQIEIEEDPQYGLSPRREGQYHEVVMKIYASDNSQAGETLVPEPEPQNDFNDERIYFTTLYDTLAKLVSGDDNAHFTTGGYLSEEGRDIAKLIILPVIGEFPHVVKGTKEDGSPAIPFPISEEGWTVEGLHWMAELAARLLQKEDLSNPVGVVDRNAPEKIVEWAKENVPELSPMITEVL